MIVDYRWYDRWREGILGRKGLSSGRRILILRWDNRWFIILRGMYMKMIYEIFLVYKLVF